MNTFQIDKNFGFLQPRKQCSPEFVAISALAVRCYGAGGEPDFHAELGQELDSLSPRVETMESESLIELHFHLARIRHLLYHGYRGRVVHALNDLLNSISARVRLPSVLTYYTVVLNNYCPSGDLPSVIDTLTGDHNEVSFIKVHHEIELALGKVPYQVWEILESNDSLDEPHLIQLYDSLSHGLEAATEIQTDLIRHVDPAFFHDRLRHLYDGLDDLNGVSGAQSPSFSLMDLILKVEHNDHFHVGQRKFMHERHVAFLEQVEHRLGMFGSAHSTDAVEEQRTLCLDKLREFRESHMQNVVRYLIRFGTDHGTGGKTKYYLDGIIDETHG